MIPTSQVLNSIAPAKQTNASSSNGELSQSQQFQLNLEQAITKSFDNLFNNSSDNSDSSSGSSDLFSGFLPSNSTQASSNTLGGDYTGLQTSTVGSSKALEMISQSNLIGKNVEAIDQSTGQKITGKVNSVSLSNNSIIFDVGGVQVPAEAMVKVAE